MQKPTVFARFIPSACLLLLTSCASLQKPKPVPPPVVQPAAKFESHWEGEGLSGPASIVVKLGEQRAYFYRGQKLAGVAKISSGRRGFETPPGSYKVIQKDRNHASNLYGDYVDVEGSVVKGNVDTSKDPVPAGATFRGAKMPYFLRFHGGYGMHAGRVPNHRASHGCIRLQAFMAKHFYENAVIGTPVQVED
jgi:lipoprotein-anchoring transpeptidase ErfK/SrfK